MERLTTKKCGELLIKCNDGEYRSPCFGCESINKCNPEKVTCGFYKALEKMAEYEDFEEIFRLKMTDLACEFLKDKEEFAKWLDRYEWIAKKCDEYARAEEQGKLLKLPCAVGDTVYSFSFYRVYVMHVESFIIYKDHIDARLVSGTPENPFLKCDIDIKELGKRWFLTREEAEDALKEL